MKVAKNPAMTVADSPAPGKGGPRAQSLGMCKTLDVEHTNTLSRMQADREVLAAVRAETRDVDAAIAAAEARERGALTDAECAELAALQDRREALARRTEDLAESSDEVAYFIRTAGVLFRYYDIVEKGERVPSAAAAASAASAASATSCASGKKSILRWFAARPLSFASPERRDDDADADGDSGYAPAPPPPAAPADPSAARPFDDRASLLDRYHRCMEDTSSAVPPTTAEREPNAPLATSAPDACTHCGSAQRTVMLQDGYVFCNKCYTVEYILVDHDKPSYKDPPREVTFFAYKRINHFNEWLSQSQGKETTDIPEDVYDSILFEIKKQKITNMATLTRKKIKEILKKLRINKFYEHTNQIISRINGIPSQHMPPELEERLRHMFCQIQVPFLRHAPPNRKNFLSYSYVLHKMMQLLDKDEYLEAYGLLKSRDKLQAQDSIWKKICEDLGWTFYASL